MSGSDRTSRALLRVSIGALIVSAAGAILAILAGDLDETSRNALFTSAAVGLYLATGSAGTSLLGDRQLAWLGAATILTSIVSAALALILIWGDGTDAEEGWGCLTAVTLACAESSALLRRRRADDSPGTRAAVAVAIVSAAVLAGLVIAEITAESSDYDDSSIRAIAVVAVVNVSCLLLIPLLRRLAAGAPRGTARSAPPAAEARVVEPGRLAAELGAFRAGGAQVVLEPTALQDGGRIAVVRAGGRTVVLLDREG